MTQVSNWALNDEVWDRIFNLFVATLASTKDKQKFKGFVEDFFSPTERIMFAKRFACAVLLSKGNDYLTIRKILHITPPTIAKVNLQIRYAGAGLKPVLSDVIRKHNFEILLEEIKDLLDLPGTKIYDGERFGRQYQRRKKIRKLKKRF
ncbi:hypothetical protein HYT59_02340 [Candidatus Woesebacteria bacterium]|nr:hypothetical protein [Candidatus Woesebacteria bacterium]